MDSIIFELLKYGGISLTWVFDKPYYEIEFEGHQVSDEISAKI